MNLPLLSMVNDYRYRDFSSLINHGLDYYLSFEGYSIVAMLIAVWAAIAAMSYLHKRVSAYHYHSMPIRREGVLLVKTVVAFTDYLIALIPNFALAGFLYMMLPHHTGISSVLTLFGCSLLAFAVTFAFTMLIGTLTGYAQLPLFADWHRRVCCPRLDPIDLCDCRQGGAFPARRLFDFLPWAADVFLAIFLLHSPNGAM